MKQIRIYLFVVLLAAAVVAAGLSYALTKADAKARIAGLITEAVLAKHPDLSASDVRVFFSFSDETFRYLSGREGGLDFAISDDYGAFDPVGNVIIPIQVLVDGKRTEKVQVRAKVEIWRDVVASKRRIEKGSLLTGNDVEISKRDVSLLSGRYILDISSVVGNQTRMGISRGTLIQDWMIRAEPFVEKNEEVRMVANLPQGSVTALGIALEDGYLGDKIKIRNRDTNREVRGEIVGTGEVLVVLN